MDITLDVIIKIERLEPDSIYHTIFTSIISDYGITAFRTPVYKNRYIRKNQIKIDHRLSNDVDARHMLDGIQTVVQGLSKPMNQKHNVHLNIIIYGGYNEGTTKVINIMDWNLALQDFTSTQLNHSITKNITHIRKPSWKKVADVVDNKNQDHYNKFRNIIKSNYKQDKTMQHLLSIKKPSANYVDTPFTVFIYEGRMVYKLPTSKKLHQTKISVIKTDKEYDTVNLSDIIKILQDYKSQRTIVRNIKLEIQTEYEVVVDDKNILKAWIAGSFKKGMFHIGSIDTFLRPELFERLASISLTNNRPNTKKEIKDAIKFLKGE